MAVAGSATVATAAPGGTVSVVLFTGADPATGAHPSTPYVLGADETLDLTVRVTNDRDEAVTVSVGVDLDGGGSLGCRRDGMVLRPGEVWSCDLTVGPYAAGTHRVYAHLNGRTEPDADGGHVDVVGLHPFLITVGAATTSTGPSEAAVGPTPSASAGVSSSPRGGVSSSAEGGVTTPPAAPTPTRVLGPAVETDGAEGGSGSLLRPLAASMGLAALGLALPTLTRRH